MKNMINYLCHLNGNNWNLNAHVMDMMIMKFIRWLNNIQQLEQILVQNVIKQDVLIMKIVKVILMQIKIKNVQIYVYQI